MTDFLHYIFPGMPETKERKLAREILADIPFLGGYVTSHGEQVWNADIQHLMDIAEKGGRGSGNFGHAGRPGEVGGSASDSVKRSITKDKAKQIVELAKDINWKKNNIKTDLPVVDEPSQLPSVKPGMTRIFHGTPIQRLQSILDNGLKKGSEIGYGERLNVILGSIDNPKMFGDAAIVFDITDFRMVNKSWVEIDRSIKPTEFIGIIRGNSPLTLSDYSEAVQKLGNI